MPSIALDASRVLFAAFVMAASTAVPTPEKSPVAIAPAMVPMISPSSLKDEIVPVIAAVVISSPLVSASNAPDFLMVMYALVKRVLHPVEAGRKAFHVPHIAKCLFQLGGELWQNTAAVRFRC